MSKIIFFQIFNLFTTDLYIIYYHGCKSVAPLSTPYISPQTTSLSGMQALDLASKGQVAIAGLIVHYL